MKAIIALALVTMAVCLSSVEAGSILYQSHGEQCSMASDLGDGLGVAHDNTQTCDPDKGLICVGNHCGCPPGKTWDPSFIGSIVGRFGQCK